MQAPSLPTFLYFFSQPPKIFQPELFFLQLKEVHVFYTEVKINNHQNI